MESTLREQVSAVLGSSGDVNAILDLLIDNDGPIGMLIERSLCTPQCLKRFSNRRGVVSWHPCGTCIDCRIRDYLDLNGFSGLMHERLYGDDASVRISVGS